MKHDHCQYVCISTKYILSYCFFCNLFIFDEKQWQIQIQKKTYDMHMQFHLDKRHLIYKTNMLQHFTEISITKDCFAGVRSSFRQPIIPTAHCSDGPLFRQPIAPTAHYSNDQYSDNPLLRQPISLTTHYSVKNCQK